jgi:hypothetical protein
VEECLSGKQKVLNSIFFLKVFSILFLIFKLVYISCTGSFIVAFPFMCTICSGLVHSLHSLFCFLK